MIDLIVIGLLVVAAVLILRGLFKLLRNLLVIGGVVWLLSYTGVLPPLSFFAGALFFLP